MSSPLSEVDGNQCRTEAKSVPASKIPNLPSSGRRNSSGRRSPFSVNERGSPSFAATTPAPPRNMASPTKVSRIPKKLHTPRNLPASKNSRSGSRLKSHHSGLPRARGAREAPTAIATTKLVNKTTSPLSNCDKPLPSPPIAQIVDPNSPPKAQRTLVDAEAGSPSTEEWPILQPENVSPATELLHFYEDTKTEVQQQPRTMSESSALLQNANATGNNRKTVSTINLNVHQHAPTQMSPTRRLSSRNPYATHANGFHAISPKADVALESPLAYKQAGPMTVSVPPRSSSKRNSLPLPKVADLELPSLPPSVALRSTKSGSAKWPLLASKSETSTATALLEQQPVANAAEIPHAKTDGVPRPSSDVVRASDTDPITQVVRLTHVSNDSISVSSQAASSSLDDEPGSVEDSVIVQRRSWRSSICGSGPVLTIYKDAEAMIMGKDAAIPDTPAVPQDIPEKTCQSRSINSLAGRLPKQAMSRMTLSLEPRSSSASSPMIGVKEVNTPIKISPIRSMQPPRELSADFSPSIPNSPALRQLSIPFLAAEKNLLCSSQKMTTPDLTPASLRSLGNPNSPTCLNIIGQQCNDDLPPPPPKPAAKAEEVLEIAEDAPILAARKHVPPSWMSPTLSSSRAKKERVDRSKAGSSPTSIGRLSDHNISSEYRKSGTSSIVSYRVGGKKTGTNSVGASKLRATESATPLSDRPTVDSNASGSPPNSRRGSQIMLSSVQTAHILVADGTNEAFAKKVKTKRSFRDIFTKRTDNKHVEKLPKISDPKLSLGANKNSIACRIRNSANFSKIHLPKLTDAKTPSPEIKVDAATMNANNADRQAALDSLEAGSSPPAPANLSHDTATIISRIVDRVNAMPEESPDRLRGLDIAEVVLKTIEHSKEAKVSAEKARMHARDAELYADRAHMGLERLLQLCEPGFDGETLQGIKHVVNSFIIPEKEGLFGAVLDVRST